MFHVLVRNACVLSSFAINFMGKRELASLLIVFLLSCDRHFSVALPLGTMGWSAVCDCGMFCSCSFTYMIQSVWVRCGT